MPDIAQNLETLRQLLGQQLAHQQLTGGSFLSGGKTPRLLAVSKKQGPEKIRAALAAGQRAFGENYVQEAQGKFPALIREFPDLRLHLIGALQTNKAAAAVQLFHVIETLDREKLAAALAAAEARTSVRREYYIEINLGDELQKAGISAAAAPDFLALCRTQYRLNITGVMGIPPLGDDPAPHFARLCALADALKLPECSMGMSADWRAALQHGSTEIRLGTAIFGQR